MDDKIKEFVTKTSTNSSVAKHYLELAEHDVEQAIQLYQVSKPTVSSSRIATFSDLKKEDQKDKGQSLYTGGEKSGLSVQQPVSQPQNLVKDILDLAAKPSRFDSEEEEQESAPSSSFFTGAGYKLGQEGQAAPMAPSQSSSVTPSLPTVERILTFWKDGFSVDDGPLNPYDAPSSKEFLESIKSGVAPVQYLNVQPGQKVEVKVARKEWTREKTQSHR